MEPVLAAAAICGFILVIFVATSFRSRAFQERFPPISDAEFVARCRPGTDPAVALKVRRVIADAYCIEYERVHPSARLADLE